jgi:hypothetical protein
MISRAATGTIIGIDAHAVIVESYLNEEAPRPALAALGVEACRFR